MGYELQTGESEVIPGAGTKASAFLGVIRRRTTEFQIPLLQLEPKEVKLGKDKVVVLVSHVSLKRRLTKGRGLEFLVYADPVGELLTVGWQLNSEAGNFLEAYTRSGAMAGASMDSVNASPENQRLLTQMLDTFHRTVFLPTVQDLFDAVQITRTSGNGFLGV